MGLKTRRALVVLPMLVSSAAATAKKVDGTVYFFNPGADDHLAVVSLGVSF